MASSFSLSPLLRTTLPTEALVSIFEDIDFFRKVFLIFIILSTTYPIVHRILKPLKNYSEAESTAKQVSILQHAVEAIVLTIATPFFTYFMIKISFVLDVDDEDALSLPDHLRADIKSTFLLCVCFMTMYLYEISSKYENARPAFVVHHLLAVLDGFLAILFPTTVMVKTCCALILHLLRITCLCWPIHVSHGSFDGMVIFAVTRPIQVLWVGAAAFGSWGDPNHVKWQAITQFVLACVLTALQLWSLTINYGVWKRCLNKIEQANVNFHNEEDGNENIKVLAISAHRTADNMRSCAEPGDNDASDENARTESSHLGIRSSRRIISMTTAVPALLLLVLVMAILFATIMIRWNVDWG
ncbi:hypothetical protein ACHAXR_001639 [Thalassiosira sp. AJA248-18]